MMPEWLFDNILIVGHAIAGIAGIYALFVLIWVAKEEIRRWAERRNRSR